MSLFNKKTRRNYRAKADASDDEVIYEPESLYEQGSKEIICGGTAAATMGTMKKVRSGLSFEDDLDPDGGDEFKVKKSNLSRKFSKQTKEHKKKKKQSDTGVVKMVNKREMIDNKPMKEEDSIDSTETLEHLRRQLSDLNGEDASSTDIMVSDNSGMSGVLRKGSIPDATTIHLARKQREKAKILLDSGGSAPDSMSSRSTQQSGRLLREDDDDDDDEDDLDDPGRFEAIATGMTTSERRPAFVVSSARDTVVRRPGIGARLKRHESELQSFRDDFLRAEHGSDRDSDQETEWERQQIQKAIHTQNPAVLEAIQPTNTRFGTDENNSIMSNLGSEFDGLDTSDITVASLKNALQAKYNTLSKSLHEHETELESAKVDLTRGRLVIAECREKLPVIAKKFRFMLEIQDYVNDLVECFNEKMGKIEYIERRANLLYRDRYDKLVERRRLDMKDFADLANLAPSQSSTTTTTGTSKTLEEMKLAEARRRRVAEREARRIRRQRARESTATGPSSVLVATTHVDGTSTDDEEPFAVIAKRKSDLDALLVDSKGMFEDVVDEFCHLPMILQRFADWHTEFPESYSDAYVALCLPQLFSPIVRVQLIGWNPFAFNANSIEQMVWFNDLLDSTCLPADPTSVKTADELNPDVQLLPLTVEKVMLDRLRDVVFSSWDPLSSRESQLLVALVRNLSTHYPTVRIGSRATEQLFTTIVKRLEVTIQDDVFIPLYSRSSMQNRQGPAFIFFQRQLRLGIKTLRNVLLWHNLLSTETLQYISLTCLINRYLLVGLASLLAVATQPPSVGDRPANQPPPPLPLMSTTQTPPQSPNILALKDAVNYLNEIFNCLPVDWLRTTSKSTKSTELAAEKAVDTDGPVNPFAQLLRFVGQLLEHCSANKEVGESNGIASNERKLDRHVESFDAQIELNALQRLWFGLTCVIEAQQPQDVAVCDV